MTTPHAELLREARDVLDALGPHGCLAGSLGLISRIDAALAAPPSAEGWIAVPVEPSEEMITAAQAVSGDMTHKVIVPTGRLIIAIYKAMLAAVSSAPANASGKLREGE